MKIFRNVLGAFTENKISLTLRLMRLQGEHRKNGRERETGI
jgi:hypothetical protein